MEGRLDAAYGRTTRVSGMHGPLTVGAGPVHAVVTGSDVSLCGAKVTWPVQSGRRLWGTLIAERCSACSSLVALSSGEG